jgi:hypothetical protein
MDIFFGSYHLIQHNLLLNKQKTPQNFMLQYNSCYHYLSSLLSKGLASNQVQKKGGCPILSQFRFPFVNRTHFIKGPNEDS